jgi:hypothetical protein
MQMSNLDFISRSELLAEIDQERKRHIDSGNYGAEHLMVHSLRRLVEEAPAVDAAPVVHGRWINQDSTYTKYQCSACKERNFDGVGRYCPNCGARMDEEE